MPKTDLKAENKALYAPPRTFTAIEVPSMTYLTIDGTGDPNTDETYRHAVESLYATSYAAKFMSKKELDRDYVVMPLEGLWWAADYGAFLRAEKSTWSWTMMIRQPDWLSPELLDRATATAAKKGAPAADLIRPKTVHEGLSVQILHVGSYDDEAPTLADLHQRHLPENGWVENGLHHEIYLNDPRKTAPEKLKTILRQPVKAAAS